MLEFLNAKNIFKAEIFAYTEAVEGGGGHSADSQISYIHGGGALYKDHPYQGYHDPHSYQEYQERGVGHHQSFPSYEEEAQRYHDNQQEGYQYQPEYDFHVCSGSYHNYHYGADKDVFHDLNQMEDALSGLVSDPEDEEEEGDIILNNFDPLERANDSGPDSDSDDDEVSRDHVPITHYNHIPNENWYVDADMKPPKVPIWGTLTRFMKGQQFGMNEVRHVVNTETMARSFE
ncbi:unnamed protein product [Linum trigynum]|uniref:Uncharacterized protein n=1 Tax=Linum trigynum TaxID=586398 RepID=A0AAV2FV78_9ROSI